MVQSIPRVVRARSNLATRFLSFSSLDEADWPGFERLEFAQLDSALLRSVSRGPHEHGCRGCDMGVPSHGRRDEGRHSWCSRRPHSGEHQARAKTRVQQGPRGKPQLLDFRLLQALRLRSPVLEPNFHLQQRKLVKG